MGIFKHEKTAKDNWKKLKSEIVFILQETSNTKNKS